MPKSGRSSRPAGNISPSPHERAADALSGQARPGKTLISRAIRGSAIGAATRLSRCAVSALRRGHLEEARDFLLSWAGVVSQGMLPNRFPDQGEQPEFNSVDASLWYHRCVNDYLLRSEKQPFAPTIGIQRSCGQRVGSDSCWLSMKALASAFGPIRMDYSQPANSGQQLTWMDARVDGREITPRIGKPGGNSGALAERARQLSRNFQRVVKSLFDKGRAAFRKQILERTRRLPRRCNRLRSSAGRCRSLHFVRTKSSRLAATARLRVAGEGRQVVDAVEMLCLRRQVCARSRQANRVMRAHYQGARASGMRFYHQGTVWPWLMGPFVEAVGSVHGSSCCTKESARTISSSALHEHPNHAGLDTSRRFATQNHRTRRAVVHSGMVVRRAPAVGTGCSCAEISDYGERYASSFSRTSFLLRSYPRVLDTNQDTS